MNISPETIIEIINNKCLTKLGTEVIVSISNTTNNKTRVKFKNGKVLNFSNYRSAFDYLNAAYNLKIENTSKIKTPYVYKKSESKTSKVEEAVKQLKEVIGSFENSQKKESAHNRFLTNYLKSYEWEVNQLSVDETYEVIENLKKSTDVLSKKYIHHIVKCLTENNFL